MYSDLLGIFGARGHGRDVLLFVSELETQRVVFVDDDSTLDNVFDIPVYTLESFADIPFSGRREIVVAISEGKLRQIIVERVKENCGIICSGLTADTALVSPLAKLGPGALIGHYSVISANTSIGKYFQCNTQTLIAHDCEIGDFVTFGPSATCNGCVSIGDFAYVGAGAILRQGSPDSPLRIGARAVIGMGAVVTRDVSPDSIVIGNPARPLERAQ